MSFSREDKKTKINGTINGSVTFTLYESYHNTLNTKLLIVFLFLVLILFILFITEPLLILKNLIREFPKKHDQTSITLTVIFDYIG